MEGAGPSEDFQFKVVLLGEGAVGKSSLLMRYVENKFSPRHISTIQASFQTKQLEVDGCHVTLNIWDTAGQEKYHALGPIYYRGSQGALLIYDITDQRSFDRAKIWLKELQRALGDTAVLMIIGNKFDLERNRTVNLEEAQEYANSMGAMYEETSAKENIGIENAFERLCKAMIVLARDSSRNRINGVVRGRRIELVDDEPVRSRNKPLQRPNVDELAANRCEVVRSRARLLGRVVRLRRVRAVRRTDTLTVRQLLVSAAMFRSLQSVRSLSTSMVSKQDLVQQAFIKKIREYAQKGGDLSADPAVKKALSDELNRLAAKFQLANTDVIGKLPTNFETPKVDSSVQQLIEGNSLAKMIEEVQKDKAAYLAAREAKKAAEAARLAALKQ
ncbi:hypothetical protein Q1695_011614 [Nippostrongylus brasiliensis]|nr:hypothetical protein Q1695_011614 [Nippostrongylus brasiliensis]